MGKGESLAIIFLSFLNWGFFTLSPGSAPVQDYHLLDIFETAFELVSVK